MKHATALLLLAAAAILTACGTVPQSRSHYIELIQNHNGLGSSQKLIYSKEVNRPFEVVVANIENRLNQCVPEGYTQTSVRGNLASSSTVTNNQRIEIVSPNKAEVTVQQHHTGTYMQSEGGLYLLAADVTKAQPNKVRLDFYTAKHYAPIAEAIENWAQGSGQCHGIGGID
ncbi:MULTISPECIES: hypothetical protein [unclassified Microbulbifer]|uniref:hypothetical protein n=1 Tax=unclassified Microbulbifer TaxID=2619833 RepID=UPI0027E45607|nr:MULTISPECIES: hypothetical protein [unclassified Microbulbifer]